jgi:long-chain fatty acid transport protein
MSLVMTRWFLIGMLVCAAFAGTRAAHAQTFGVELHNNLMPAAGGMGGVSIAKPQDLTSGINGNPATLTQFVGTQVMFGGAWTEPTFNMTQDVRCRCSE